MKTLSIDIETFSDVQLPKTGVYRYCESSKFEILLFAYSVDAGPVQIIDIACGEKIPEDVITALEDDSVIKWAFNASFESIYLSRFLGYPFGDYLSPESWRCSMIWAATMGLPLSLEGVALFSVLKSRNLQKEKTSSSISVSPALLQNPMVAEPETNLFTLPINGKPSNVITSVMLKQKWVSSRNFINSRFQIASGKNTISTKKSMTVVSDLIWSLCIKLLKWTRVPVKN